MHGIVLVLACLACAGKVWSVQAPADGMHRRLSAARKHWPVILQDPANNSAAFATFLLALNPVAAAFSPASTGSPVYASRRSLELPEEIYTRHSPKPCMVAAKDVFRAYSKQATLVQRRIWGLPVNTYEKYIPPTRFVVLAALAMGFINTPSYRIWVKSIGAWVSSNIAFNTGKYLTTTRQKAAIPAVAAVLGENFNEVPVDTLYAIAHKCGMTIGQLRLVSTDLYLIFFEACLQNMLFDKKEIDDLKQLQVILKMSAREVGTEVFKAAKRLKSKYFHPKYAFLAERVLRHDCDKGGYEYEVTRIQKRLKLSSDDWLSLAGDQALYLSAEEWLNNADIFEI